MAPRLRAPAAAVAILAIGMFAALPSSAVAAGGTKLTLRDSPFGQMVWAPHRQALYMFAPDDRGKPTCYGACARAWPPVLTRGGPSAGAGLDDELLGTVRRRNGDRQVTYDGRPLYTYVNEGRGQVLCHDVFLNGGWWYALGADGERLP